MRILDIANALNRDDMFAIDADKRSKASIDGSMIYLLCGRVSLRYYLEMVNDIL
jgi:hypothetical protein